MKEQSLHDGYDEEFDTYILNEDKLCDGLEDILASGACIVDFHSCDFFPERWFDLVIVLRADNKHVYDRLMNRGYRNNKIEQNVEAEIMQIVLDEAKASYASEIVVETLQQYSRRHGGKLGQN